MPEIEEVMTGSQGGTKAPGLATEGVSTERSAEQPDDQVEPGSDADLERFFKKVGCTASCLKSARRVDGLCSPGAKSALSLTTLPLAHAGTREAALTTKHLQWGWKNLDKRDGAALAWVIRNNTTCITLDLFVNEIFSMAGVLVGAALADNAKLKSIDLQQAQLGPEGGKAIAESLKLNRTLMNLKLYYNCLGPEGTRYLAEALKRNEKLTNLDLGDNGIGIEGCRALAETLARNKHLARLDVSKNAGVQNSPEAKAILTVRVCPGPACLPPCPPPPCMRRRTADH